MTRALGGAVCACLLVLAACGGATTARHRASPSPRPRLATTSTPTPTPAPTAGAGPVASPSATPSPSPPAPIPTATTLIPHHSQSLALSGAVTGSVSSAEVKECGTGNGGWALELSSMAVDGGTASLTLLVNPFHGDGSYVPSGALNTILNQQLATFPVTGGSVDIAQSGASGQIDLTLTSSANQQVRIQGTWACG